VVDPDSFRLISDPSSARLLAQEERGAIMVKSKSARASRRDRNGKRRTTPKLEEPVYGIHVPEALHEAIENERGTLAQAVSILRCLAISLESDMGRAVLPRCRGDCVQVSRPGARRTGFTQPEKLRNTG
jgi:hypothetical protein